MPTLSGGINLALTAVLAQTQSMEIIEHNVANANTPGYRRQAAILSATQSSPAMGYEHGYLAGQIGTGVTISQIQRFNLQFFDGRYRAVSADSANWAQQQDIMTQLQSTLAETSTDGMLPKLDQFWTNWSNLAADPSNTALRSQVLTDTTGLTDAFNRRSQQLDQLRSDQNLAISSSTGQINEMASQVADLNAQISHVLSVGEQPNDLKDKRDILLDNLSKMTGAVSTEQADGESIVSINGHVLVVGHDTFKLNAQPDAAGLNQIKWADGQAMVPASGTLKGLFTVRDTTIPAQTAGLNALAKQVIDSVNTIYHPGFGLDGTTNQDFFSGTDAATIKLNAAVTATNLAAAGAAGEPGNNTVATAIAALNVSKVMNGNTTTMGDYYNSVITTLAQQTQQATDNSTHQNVVLKALGDQRESVAGVNLDEEAANMMKYQRAYQAATRVMTAYDEMLDKVINSMGLVGR